MKNQIFKIALVACALFAFSASFAQSKLIRNLAAGKHQTLVTYGTSLTQAEGGRAWVDSVNKALNKQYNGLLTIINTAKGGRWSTWGVQNLEDSVIKKAPDAVLIEFAMNDAFADYKTNVEVARLNLNYMIDRIKLYKPECEVILQTMNIPLNEHGQTRPNILAYYQMYRDVAKARKLLLIDHYPHWKELLDKGIDAYIKAVPDGIHPGVEASKQIIAPYVIKRLEDK
ncbi:SGNH/GDSL hydrolase family protein [Mucilaginibacter corticis]|uniref:SGNH/GDSL hydrolase family protein n=1 Tax=Mucilaginibacter corticis TaxID=2597670 RepID=UPI001C8FB8A3|nr:GDSL-type esterase/lipase family protein [Mucilaginibacter corticis]